MFQKFQKSLFTNRLKAAGIYTQVHASQQLEHAKRVLKDQFGEGIEQHAKPVYIKNRALTIEVSHSAISEELLRRQETIISAINTLYGRTEVVRIQCILPRRKENYSS